MTAFVEALSEPEMIVRIPLHVIQPAFSAIVLTQWFLIASLVISSWNILTKRE